ncbi:hypothetical protein PMM47T1_24620 [Pseudomonas sp. M47T1]|nr:hypothetical protein PMM47T1_24620 [Pseudomonas sp. M47T1]
MRFLLWLSAFVWASTALADTTAALSTPVEGRFALPYAFAADANSVEVRSRETAPIHGVYLAYVNYWGNYSNGGYDLEGRGNRSEVITSAPDLHLLNPAPHG